MKSNLVFTLTALLVFCACGRRAEYRTASGVVWGTEYHITYLADRDLNDSIVYEMRRVDRSLSPFEANSLISRINRGEDVSADSLWIDVFKLSQRVNSLSHGAFDPTVAPLVNLWGFGYTDGSADRPSAAQIDSALATVGIAECRIDSCCHVHKKHPATEFNFSAVAKGYGVDLVAAMLRRNGCNDFMVEIGGEVSLSGDSPRAPKWRIQVDAPIDDALGEVHEQLMLLHTTGIGIATSGNYRNFRDTSAGRVGHTISPVSGEPVVTNVLSATVIAPTTAEADALATAIMAMSHDQALRIIESIPNIEAMIVINDDTRPKVITTAGFKEHLYKK